MTLTEPAMPPRDDEVLPVPRFWRRLLTRPGTIAALAYLVGLGLIALLAPVIAPADPLVQDLRSTFRGPGAHGHLLGTDELGRDVLSRLMHGSRVSVLAAVQAVGIGVVAGVPFGVVAGYFGGRVDALISRVADGVLSFPPLILAIAIVGVLGPGLTNAMIAIGIVFAPRFLRLVRSSVLSVREETFIEASRSIGTSDLWILRRHVLPNVMSPLLVQVTLATGLAMLSEAGLSFLGLGVQPPEASWGAMLGGAFRHISREPWQSVYPGLLIALTVLAFNVLGDGVRDAIGRRHVRGAR